MSLGVNNMPCEQWILQRQQGYSNAEGGDDDIAWRMRKFADSKDKNSVSLDFVRFLVA